MSTVSQNGYLSEYFKISRGCRQGDPLSPYIFILCAEILAILIKNNKDISGITIGNKDYKISQYADDTTMILDGSRKSCDETLSTLECFSKFSGLKINNNKTKIVWIGSKKFSKDVYHHIRWKFDLDCTSFNLLGIDFNINVEELIDYNFGKYIPKIKSTLLQWSRRNITPLGKITVLKTLIIPILNHLFIALPTPKK